MLCSLWESLSPSRNCFSFIINSSARMRHRKSLRWLDVPYLLRLCDITLYSLWNFELKLMWLGLNLVDYGDDLGGFLLMQSWERGSHVPSVHGVWSLLPGKTGQHKQDFQLVPQKQPACRPSAGGFTDDWGGHSWDGGTRLWKQKFGEPYYSRLNLWLGTWLLTFLGWLKLPFKGHWFLINPKAIPFPPLMATLLLKPLSFKSLFQWPHPHLYFTADCIQDQS